MGFVEYLIYITVSLWITVSGSFNVLTMAFGIAVSAIGIVLVRRALS
jgi:multisubunit Na+/H+ antiporter MnhE subunit